MKEFQCTITADNGLHARPAGMLASSLRRFSSDIKVSTGEKEADGKRLLSLMSLGATQGTTLTFTVVGTDEDEALREIRCFCREQLGGADERGR